MGTILIQHPDIWEFNHLRDPLNELYFGYPLPYTIYCENDDWNGEWRYDRRELRADLANGKASLDDGRHQGRFLDWMRDDSVVVFKDKVSKERVCSPVCRRGNRQYAMKKARQRDAFLEGIGRKVKEFLEMLPEESEEEDSQPTRWEFKRTMPRFVYEDMVIKRAKKMLRKFKIIEDPPPETASTIS